jgi:hypothetical protein
MAAAGRRVSTADGNSPTVDRTLGVDTARYGGRDYAVTKNRAVIALLGFDELLTT